MGGLGGGQKPRLESSGGGSDQGVSTGVGMIGEVVGYNLEQGHLF